MQHPKRRPRYREGPSSPLARAPGLRDQGKDRDGKRTLSSQEMIFFLIVLWSAGFFCGYIVSILLGMAVL
jgi:hypothetical protein